MFLVHGGGVQNVERSGIGDARIRLFPYTDNEQKAEAKSFIKELKKSLNVVTELKPLDKFYEAESYHKDYYAKNPDKPYCQPVINPKLEKVQKQFAKFIR